MKTGQGPQGPCPVMMYRKRPRRAVQLQVTAAGACAPSVSVAVTVAVPFVGVEFQVTVVVPPDAATGEVAVTPTTPDTVTVYGGVPPVMATTGNT